MKILITADGHHSKLMFNKNDECIKFVNDLMEREKPAMFVIAGDLNDTQNLKSGSDEMRALIKFIKETTSTAKRLNIKYVILRGTKGHDGEVIKTIHTSIGEIDGPNTFMYIDEPQIMYLDNRTFLFLPEMYVPTIQDFENTLDDLLRDINKVDCIFFHGMFDFAIPQLKQIDSSYGLNRSVVMDSEKMRNRFKLCAVGGHVHAQIKHRNIIYTNSMINSIGDTDMTLGIGKLTLYHNSYDYETIANPYNIAHKVVYIDFTKRTFGEIDNEMNEIISQYDLNYVIINAIVDANYTTLHNYTAFIKKYNPKHIKKKIVDNKKDTNMDKQNSEMKTRTTLTEDDVIKIILEIAENKYVKKLEQPSVIKYLKVKQGD